MYNLSVHDKIYKILAEKYNIHYTIVERVCRHQLEFVAKTMRDDKKYSVRLKYLGLFGVKNYREKLRNEIIRRHKEVHGEEKEKFYERLKREKLNRDNQGHKPEEPLV
jgi:hypothetical protein